MAYDPWLNGGLAAEQDYSDETGLMQKIGYGALGAVVSGVQGFWNTGADLGNAFGANIEKADTADWLKQNVSGEASRFYQDNQTILDGIGFFATSLVPGGLAIKAAGAARMGKLLGTMKLATGLENGIAGKYVAQAAQVAREGSMTANIWSPKIRAAFGAVADNAIDGAVAGTAILATENQNAAINQENLGYFQSFKANFNDFVNPFTSPVALGLFGITSGIGALSAVGKVNAAINSADLARNARLIYSGTEGVGASIGDAYLNLQRQKAEKIKLTTGVDPSTVEFKDLSGTADRIDTAAKGILQTAIKSQDTDLSNMVTNTMIGQKSLDDQAALFSGLQQVQRVQRSLGPVANDEITSPMYRVMNLMDSKEYEKALGLPKVDGFYAPTGIPEGAGVPPEAGPTVFTQSINYFMKQGADYNEAMLGTYLHETGHHRTWDIATSGMDASRDQQLFTVNNFAPRVIQRLKDDEMYKMKGPYKKIVDTTETLAEELEQLSRDARPLHWKELDTLKAAADSPNATEANLKAYNDKLSYLYNPSELMADAYQTLNSNGIAAKKYISQTPNIYKLYKRNGVLFEQYALNKVGYDSWRGAAVDNVNAATSTLKVTPQVGDIGNLQLADKGNTISWGEGARTRTVDLTGDWNPSVLSPEDSDAMFAGQHMRWSDDKYAIANWDKPTSLDNIPELQARMAKARAWKDAGLDKQFPERGQIHTVDIATDSHSTMEPFELEQHIIQAKKDWSQKLNQANVDAENGDRLNPQEFERALNIDQNASIGNETGDWATYTSHDPTKPRHAILSYDKRMDITDEQARSMVGVMGRIDQIKTQAQRIAANTLENRWGEGQTLLDMAENPGSTSTVTRASKTRGFLNSANNEYGTMGSFAQAIGKYVDKLAGKINDSVNREAGAAFLATVNNRDALAEVNTLIASKLRGADGWTAFDSIHPDNAQDAGILRKMGLLAKEETGHGKVLVNADLLSDIDKAIVRSKGDVDLLEPMLERLKAQYQDRAIIPLKNEDSFSALRWMQDANAEMVGDKVRLRSATGRGLNWATDRIYIPPPNENQFTHVAFLKKTVPEGLGKADEHSVIFGQDAQDLANKINIIKENIPDAQVLTKDEMIAYKKAKGDYDPSEMLQERRFNTELRRLGLLNSPLPRSDTLELSAFTDYLKRQHITNARDATSLMFANEISELSHQAQLFENVSASQTQGLSRIFRSRESANPYQSTIDTMLNKNSGKQWGLWTSLAETVDSGFSKVAGAVSDKFRRATTDEDFQAINKYLSDIGLQPAYKTAIELQDVNRVVDRRLLSATVGKANSIVAMGQLGLDFLEAVVNAVSLPIMMLPELHNLTGAFDRPEFKELFGTTIPGTKTQLPSSMKAISKALVDYTGAITGQNSKIEDYMKLGLLGRELQFVKQATQEIVVPSEIFGMADAGKTKAALLNWNARISGAVDVAKKFTFAESSEQAIRFISANVAEQIAKAAGITDKGQQVALMNTFINRVHGNYTAAQKPFLFQGVIGQAISLFQTYQFNLMQQAFRNVADGNKKAAAMMLGLQGTIYGMRGLPGFNMLNQQIGAIHGNTGNDVVSGTYNNVDPKLADWLVYGGASNLLGVDLFNRGDINPRTATIVPTNIADIPAVSVATKFFGNLAHTAESLNQAGLNGNTLLEGVAHNSINRPLAGLAAVALGYRTTNKGGLLMAQKDEEAWASTAAALVGGKSIDEAIAVDTLYRKVAYDAARTKDIQDLGSKYLGAIRSGGEIDQEGMMQAYIKHGGTQEKYNQWFQQLSKNANEGQLQKIVSDHHSENGKFYQGIIGTDRSLATVRSPTMYQQDIPQQSVSPDMAAQMPAQ